VTAGPRPGRERLRLLFLLPFPPRTDGTHGASRMTGELLRELAARHELAAVYMRAPDEPPIDPALAATASVAVEVARPAVRGPGRVRRSTRRTCCCAATASRWRSSALSRSRK